MQIFLDLDGTLLDSSRRHAILLEKILSEKNIDADVTNYIDYKNDGFSTKKYLTEFLGMSKDVSNDIATLWVQNIENDEFLVDDKLYEDTIEALEYFKSYVDKMYLVTARNNHKGVTDTLDRLGITKYFDDIVVVSPANASYEKCNYIKAKMNENDILIGDTEVEYEISKVLGIKTYLLNRGFRSKAFWDDKGIKSYNSLNDIIRCIKKRTI